MMTGFWTLLVFIHGYLLVTIGRGLFFLISLPGVQEFSGLLMLLLLLAIIVIWLNCFSTFDKVDKQKLRVKFFSQDLQGKHVINKFSVPVSFLEKLVPIVKIYKDGIVEFKGKKFGVLMETHPMRISEEERAIHEKRMEKVINGIPANTHFKTIACSRLEPRKPILHYLLEVANKSNGDKATDLHLTGTLQQNSWGLQPCNFLEILCFFKSWGMENDRRSSYSIWCNCARLFKNMRVARLQPRIYTDENEISTAYRTMFGEMVI